MMNRGKKELTEQDEKMIKLVRGLANGIGIILFLLMVVNAIQQGGINRLVNLNGQETIIFVCILSMFFGMIWALQKAIAGGILMIVAYVIMAITMGTIWPDAILPVFLFVGIMHLFLGIKEG